MSRAPRKPDERQGPDNGSQRALRLVVAPEVIARPAKLFPFAAALGVGMWVLALFAFGGSLIWIRMIVALPEEVQVPMVVESVSSEEPVEPPVEQPVFARTVEALPVSPPVTISVQVPVMAPADVPKPDVALLDTPFDIVETWEEADESFTTPERTKPVSKVKPKRPSERPVASRPKVAPPVKRTPQIARQVPPVYPAAARRSGTEGTVLLQVDVQSSGRPGLVSLVSSSGSGLLDSAAIRAVKKWTFRPATIAGVPTSGQVRVPVRFRLQ